ncbi:unnamed protein product, partial [Prorocentrum cordatum]
KPRLASSSVPERRRGARPGLRSAVRVGAASFHGPPRGRPAAAPALRPRPGGRRAPALPGRRLRRGLHRALLAHLVGGGGEVRHGQVAGRPAVAPQRGDRAGGPVGARRALPAGGRRPGPALRGRGGALHLPARGLRRARRRGRARLPGARARRGAQRRGPVVGPRPGGAVRAAPPRPASRGEPGPDVGRLGKRGPPRRASGPQRTRRGDKPVLGQRSGHTVDTALSCGSGALLLAAHTARGGGELERSIHQKKGPRLGKIEASDVWGGTTTKRAAAPSASQRRRGVTAPGARASHNARALGGLPPCSPVAA